MNGNMRAAVYKGIGVLNIETLPIPQIETPYEVLIKVKQCSICGTDVHMMKVPPTYEATPNTILGHELVGEVVEIGTGVRYIEVGDRVVVNPNENCEVCHNCRRGLANHCLNNKSMGITNDGGFAEYVKTSEKQVFVISEHLSDDEAVFAEPLSCAMNGYSRIAVHLLSKVVVIGCGPIGLMFAMLARRDGARVVTVETNPYRIKIAKKLGFEVANPFTDDVPAFVEAQLGSLADYVIDAAGSQLPVAIDLCGCRGTILIFGVNNKLEPSIVPGKIQSKELTIIGSFIANSTMPAAIEVLESHILDVKPLITHYLPLEEIKRGMELMTTGEGMEIIITL